MQKYARHLTGQNAEMLACQYLQARGFHLLEKNYRCYSGEIDLIMQDQDDVVFVEVRSRQNDDFGTALETINRAKQRKLCKAAIHFLQLKKWLYKINSRFDVIAIQKTNGAQTIQWIKHAFEVQTYL